MDVILELSCIVPAFSFTRSFHLPTQLPVPSVGSPDRFPDRLADINSVRSFVSLSELFSEAYDLFWKLPEIRPSGVLFRRAGRRFSSFCNGLGCLHGLPSSVENMISDLSPAFSTKQDCKCFSVATESCPVPRFIFFCWNRLWCGPCFKPLCEKSYREWQRSGHSIFCLLNFSCPSDVSTLRSSWKPCL